MSGILYKLLQRCLDPVSDDHTRDTYTRGLNKFSNFLAESGTSQRHAIRAANNHDATLVQQFCTWLTEKDYASASVHTFLAPVCKAFGLNMRQIDKPPRISSRATRGRDPHKNPRGKADLVNPKYARITGFARAVGIRRGEYKDLIGRNILYDSSGNPYAVEVMSGKGGRHTINYILPQHQAAVAAIVRGIAPDQHIFSDEEMRTRADLHQFRRIVAREALNYYDNMSKEERDILKKELIESYIADKKGVTPEKIERFRKELNNPTPYILRGTNAEKARREGRPLQYDRLSLYLVSSRHLAHWRIDVTVNSYLQ